MRHAKPRFAEGAGRLTPAVVFFCAAIVGLACSASSALATPHPVITGEYGKEGPKASGLGSGCRIGWASATQRLYLYSDTKIYGLERTSPGSVTALAGGFPIALPGIGSSCGDRDLGVDNSGTGSAGNIYIVPSSPGNIYGYDPSGAALPPPWPVSGGNGETCGVAPDNQGNVWGGHYSGSELTKFSSAGSLLNSYPFGGNICKLEVDQSNNDVIGQEYGGTLYRLKPPYTTKEPIVATNQTNPGLAVNGIESKVYVATGGPSVNAYDLDTGAIVETITPPGGAELSVDDVAVDENTDTVFLVVDPTDADEYNDAYIVEYLGVITPKATTGAPTGNEEVSGTADPNGVGPITDCYFEFGPTTSYGSKQDCSEPVPFNSEQTVHAVLPGLTSEVTYHYRLVLDTGVENVVGRGADRTITPHDVRGLKTEAPVSIDRGTAVLKGSFEGNGEETHYYFEWGTTTAYGTRSATPPGPSAGSPNFPPVTPLTHTATGLEPETVYHYRVVGENGVGVTEAEDVPFKTPPAVQSLTTKGADVVPGAATLHASYLGDGNPTSYYFEYVDYVDYDPSATNPYEAGQTTAAIPGADAGSGTGPQELTADADSLEPYEEYHYRVVATNLFGTTYGADQTFFSSPPFLPAVSATFSSDVTQTAARLSARVNPGGGPTVVRFEYGAGAGYGSRTPASDPIGSDGTDHLTSATISSLEPGTTYHFRALATNFAGTTYGPDQTVTTASPPSPPILSPPAVPTPVPPVSRSPQASCGGYDQRAKRNSNRAERLRRKAAHTSGDRSRELSQKAARFAKQARKLSRQGKACRRQIRSRSR